MTTPRGRFRTPLDPGALAFSSSLMVDSRLYREDIEGSCAHVAMLAKQGIIPVAAAKKLRTALREIRKEIETGRMVFSMEGKKRGRLAADDVHMAIEQRLIEKVGEVGKMVHTARSRNDQVALDERLYLRNATKQLRAHVNDLRTVLTCKAVGV